jgi:hypothetical protein
MKSSTASMKLSEIENSLAVVETMLAVEIRTSKSGRLWPTGYWKTLFDSLACKGSKNDPRIANRDLTEFLEPQTQPRTGRYFLHLCSPLAEHDDSTVQFISVFRVPAGTESITVGRVLLDWDAWSPPIDVPYFGTIGNSKYEAQSKLNGVKIIAQCEALFDRCLVSRSLGLGFQMSNERRERDLDNLGDGLMTAINARCKSIDHLCLVKLEPVICNQEFLRLTSEAVPASFLRP